MQTVTYILLGVLLLAALFIVVAVLLQKSKDEGLSGSIAGGSSQTYFGRDGGDRKEKTLKKWTIVAGVVFVLAVLVVYFMQPSYSDTLPVGSWKDLSSYSTLFD